MAPRGFKRPQWPQEAPRGAQELPQDEAQNHQKNLKIVLLFRCILILRWDGPKKPQAGPKMDLDAHLSVWRRSRNDGVRELKRDLTRRWAGEVSTAISGPSKPRGAILVPCWGHVGAILGRLLGPSWSQDAPVSGFIHPEAILAPWGHPWGHLGPLGASWGHLGAVLVPPLGASWGHLGAILGHLGATLGPPWGYLGAS